MISYKNRNVNTRKFNTSNRYLHSLYTYCLFFVQLNFSTKLRKEKIKKTTKNCKHNDYN